MRRGVPVIGLMCLCLFFLGTSDVHGQSNAWIVAWGANDDGQCTVPLPNVDFVAVAGGGLHSLGLKSDRTIVAWGWNWDGQCNVPSPNEDFVAVAAGGDHSLGLRSDGTIVAWGSNTDPNGNYTGQCDVPAPNEGFSAVAGGGLHSLGLKSDGTIVAWGDNENGQCTVPSPNADFVAVAAGRNHSLGLKSDGTIVAWGEGWYVPSPNADFVAVAAGVYYSLGLKSDGTIVAWGNNEYGQCDVPAPNEGFVGVAAGGWHSLGVKSDGTIVAWGNNGFGQCDVPAPNEGFAVVAGGGLHSLGIRYRAPVAVALTGVAADAREGAIVIHWETVTDEPLGGFRLYRAHGPGDFTCITGSPLSPDARSYEDRAIELGREYRYMVAALTMGGRETRSAEVVARSIAPALTLNQNFPNPFNPQTTISFCLQSSSHVQLDIYDLEGRLVKRLIAEPLQAGRHEIEWNGRDKSGRTVASGVFFYRLTVGKESFEKKMILLR